MTNEMETRIEAVAAEMVASDLHTWQAASTLMRTMYGWTGGAVRIASVQATQLAEAMRHGNA